MLPVFSSPYVTILHCGAEGVTRERFRRHGGRLQGDHRSESRIPAVGGDRDAWLEHSCAVLRAQRPAGRGLEPAVLVLPPQVTLLKHLRIPRVDAGKRARIIGFEAGQAIPQPLPEVIWGSVVSGESETRQDILLVAAKLTLVEALCAAAHDAGFSVNLVVPSALALLAACRMCQPVQNQAELVLKVEPGAAVLLQLSGRDFAVRSLLVGEDERADENALAARLAAEAGRTVAHFQQQCGLPMPVRLRVAGGGLAEAAGRAMAGQLKVPWQGWEGDLPPDSLVGAAAMQWLPAHAVANLLPPRLGTTQRRRGRRPWLAAAAVLSLAAPVGPLIHFHQLVRSAEAKAVELESGLAPLRVREARNRAGLEQLARLERQIAIWQSLRKRQSGWLQLLADFQHRLVRVEDVWFERMSVVAATGKEPLKLVVAGRMLERDLAHEPGAAVAVSRMKVLSDTLAASPFVSAVEQERYDRSQSGLLGFEIVLVTRANSALQP